MMAGSLLSHGFLCSSPPLVKKNRTEKNPNKTNTGKTKQKQLPYTGNSCVKERGKSRAISLYESCQTQRGFLGTIRQPLKQPKTKSCLVGAPLSFFLSILFSLCSVSSLLERVEGREEGERDGEIMEEGMQPGRREIYKGRVKGVWGGIQKKYSLKVGCFY